MKLLANENFPRIVVDALVAAGHDAVWVRTACPGIADSDVLALEVSEDRVLVTFDKDFGHLAFHHGLPATSGVIQLRLSLADPLTASAVIVRALAARADWSGFFSVVTERQIRMRPLPAKPSP